MKKVLNLFFIMVILSGLTCGCWKKEDIKRFLPENNRQEKLEDAKEKDEIAQVKAEISQKKMDKLSQKKETFDNINHKDEFQVAANSYNSQNYTDAILGFNKVLKDNPKNYKAHCMLAMSYAKKGENGSAEMVLTRAIEQFPD